MAKAFMGIQLRRLREERGLTQAALARALQISASYLNQIERNARPLTVPLMLRLNDLFGLSVEPLSVGDEARLITDLRAALADRGHDAPLAELRELATHMPDIARSIVEMQRALRSAEERAALGDEAFGQSDATAFEAVRDWFYDRRNHVAELDHAAEQIGAALPKGRMTAGLIDRLAGRHGVRIARGADDGPLRRYDSDAGILYLSPHLGQSQQAFQIATQLAFLEQGALIGRLSGDPAMTAGAQSLLRIGLANYFAGSLILPYQDFLQTAEAMDYDIDLIANHFGIGFETTCHRLSTLQRPGAEGVPFFFIRVDRAGNISKRQSAIDFHFSRIGGSCPLWNVYEAFSRPGQVLRQIAQMPDGRSYLLIARTVSHGQGGFRAPTKTFAVALGCDLTHAPRLVYARGLDLRSPAQAVPIGPGCKLCERTSCPQRAFPRVGRPLASDPAVARFAPYSS
ncbi:MAG: Cro/Cl family transcriptional regulator [Paracoccus denitrificans]|nr:MAG: Cro/Cl family transcriptional regulator [Paracoccus denitrificans]PZO84078.1 MAG: Cro/Cl family transcriptional regulator [Paracoccus denitrificans]